jgi:hypothetical protein
MMAMAINTLQIANRLKAAEREGRAAEEIALVLGEVEEERFARIVTREQLAVELEKIRAQIEKLRAELHGEIEKLRLELQSETGKIRGELDKLKLELKHDLTLRFGAMIVAAVAVLGGLNIFF